MAGMILDNVIHLFNNDRPVVIWCPKWPSKRIAEARIQTLKLTLDNQCDTYDHILAKQIFFINIKDNKSLKYKILDRA